jgi:hypothetical protein
MVPSSRPERPSPAWLVACAGLLLLLSGLYRVRTFDTFFHLAAGRLVLARGAVPTVDPFSFTFAGARWLDHSWGFQALLAALYGVGGFVALSLWQALTACLAGGLTWWPVRPDRAAWGLGAVLAVLPAVALREVLEARPHMLAFVCLALALLLIGRVFRGGSVWSLAWLLPLQALWLTVHGSHVLLLGLLASAALVLSTLRRARLATAFVLALGAALTLVMLFAPDALTQGTDHLRSSFLEGQVQEWYPVTLSDLVSYWPGRAMLLLLLLPALGAVSLLHTLVRARSLTTDSVERSVDAYQLLLWALFAALALSSRRMLALYALGAGPVWLPLAIRGARTLGSRLPRERLRLAELALPAAALGCLALVLLCAPGPFDLGPGLMPGRFPERAVAHIESTKRIARIYNAYNFGGYLMWQRPAAGVFVDGRAITVYPAVFLEAFERAYVDMPTFEGLATRFAVDGVLLPTSSARTAPLRSYLEASPRWRVSYRDEIAVVYERSSAR